MVFFVFKTVDIRYQLWYLIVGSAVVVVILGFHRRRTKWVWPGASRRGIQLAVTSLVVGFIFVLAVSLWNSPINPKFFAWSAAVGIIVLCKVLHALNVLYFSKRKYAQACEGRVQVAATDKGQPVQSDDDLLTRFSRIYSIVAVVIFVAFFLYSGAVLGPPLQKTIYILLETGSIVGILSSFVFRIAAHLVEGKEKTKAGKARNSAW
jgi:hypothetical protein